QLRSTQAVKHLLPRVAPHYSSSEGEQIIGAGAGSRRRVGCGDQFAHFRSHLWKTFRGDTASSALNAFLNSSIGSAFPNIRPSTAALRIKGSSRFHLYQIALTKFKNTATQM